MMANETKNQKHFGTYDVVVIGLMAALCFVTIYIKIDVPTPMGKTMMHLGNAFCLLSGMLLGGVRGGLAAGIGTMFYDLLDPAFVSSAPFTFLFKFIMAFLAGTFARGGGAESKNFVKNLIGCIVGEAAYIVLYLVKSYITSYYLERNAIEAVMGSLLTKFGTSIVNALVAVVLSLILLPIFLNVAKRSGIYAKLFPKVNK